jgi:hypothetical protein
MVEGGKWIQEAVSEHPGAFSKKAEKAGMSTAAYAAKVTANPEEYEKRTVKQANLAKTLSKLRKKTGK